MGERWGGAISNEPCAPVLSLVLPPLTSSVSWEKIMFDVKSVGIVLNSMISRVYRLI